jgi:hypothetical protein
LTTPELARIDGVPAPPIDRAVSLTALVREALATSAAAGDPPVLH